MKPMSLKSRLSTVKSTLQPAKQYQSFNVRADFLTYPLIKIVIKRIISGQLSDGSQQEMPLKKLTQFLTVQNDLGYNGARPFIPTSLRGNVIERAHGTHAGVFEI